MALVNTGLQIEIKGIQKALTELAELDQRQDSLSLSAEQLLSSINGVNLAFKSIQTQAGTVGKAFDKITINVFSQNVQQASTNLDGFSTKVQATVPHLQNIANASRDINKDKLLALSSVKIDANSFQQASTAIDLLADKFNELTTTLNGGVINTLERFVNTLNTTGTNTGQFGNEVNQLALGLQKLEKVKDLNTISENFNKFLSVLRRLRDIEVTGSLVEIGNIGPAIRSIGAGLKDFSKTTASLNTKSINDLFNVLRNFNNLNITNIAVAMPTFANSLTQLAEAFRRFSSGEPGDKLPASLKAVTDALSKLTKVFDTTNNTTVDIRALGDNMAAVAPHIEQFANAMRKFTTGKEIDNLPQRMKDIREAFKDIRDAFNFKDIDVLAPKIQALAPALEQLAVAFRTFTTGTNIKNLSTQISTIITALREFTRLDLSSASNDIGTLAPSIKALAEAFRSFTTGTNIDDLPKRVQNIVNSINQLKGLNLEGLASSLKETTEPLSKFFSVFRLFSGSEKFDNLGKRFSELAQALQQLKKLNLAQFSKELQSVSTGLNSLVKASQLVNSQNINKLGAVFAQVRKEAQANTIANRALSISYNLLVRPITATASGLRTLATAIVKVPFNIFIGQLKLLKALFIDLPIGVVTKTFKLLVNTIRLVIQIFTQLAQRIKQIQDTFKNIITVVKLLLLPLTLLIEAFKAFINVGAKVASIFTAFKVNKVSEDVKKLSTNLTQANKELNTTASTANRAESELRQTDQQFEQVADSSKRAASGINLASVATRAIQVGQVALLGVGIASATKKILAFVAAAKSLQVIGTVFQRLNIAVQQFGRQIIGGAFEATAEFEQLRLQIQSLLAKDFVKLGKAGSVKEALGLEELNTTFNETLAIIKKLAIESPFENVDITKIFQMAQSFGFMREEALDMTAILTDASAALGLSGDDAREVAKVFGQIKSLGKVLAGDVNQLAQRGINVKTIFKEVGLSMEEVQKGALSADDAIKLILGTLKRDFGGAAARATNTLQGLQSTFESLRKDTLRTLFTPLFEGLKPFVSELLGTFQNDEFLASIERLGNILRDNVLGAILAIAKPLVAITTTFINLPEPIQRTVVLLARMAATALLVSTAVAVVQAGLVVFGTALAFIFNPISLIVGGIITLITSLVTARDTIGKLAAFIGEYVVTQFSNFISYFPQLDVALATWSISINKVGTDIGNVFNAITSVITGFFGVVNTPVAATGLSTVPTYLDSITLAFNNTTSEIKDFGTTFGATGKAVEANVGTIADKFVEFEQTAGLTLDKIKTPFDDFLVTLDIFAKSVANKILFINDRINQFGTFIGTIFASINTVIQPGVDAFNLALASLGTSFSGVVTLISTNFGNITNAVLDEFGLLGTAITNGLNNIGDFFGGFLTDTTDFGGGLVGAFAEGILATLNVVADALLEIAKLVTFWLEPGSPPRILPNIDKWGEGLILAWIDGMGNGVQQAF
ncbi:MAG: tape measure protein, partial [Candidatus Riesia sp.]|nr:tape measure protein [Candidatus Riesia sp.]